MIMRYITAIHMSGGEKHEHIAKVRWSEPGAGSGESTRSEMVTWINNGGDARVKAPSGDVKVVVVPGNPPYLRTRANGVDTDNLLSLPRY
jgi:Protein of unknown function (DUF3892)